MAQFDLSVSSVSAGQTVTNASAQFTLTLVDGQLYRLCSSTAAWIKFGANPTATIAGANCHFITPNYPTTILVNGTGQKVAIIRDAVDGNASLSLASP